MIANELRIGNWINYLGKPKKCSLNTIYAISRIVGDSAVYRPIPLTSEILIKAGFKKHKNVIDGDFWLIEGELRIKPKSNQLWFLSNNGDARLDHTHQLQNLYFALTQTELTIDLS